MSEIGWVCLSDTHFGAENSILSHLPPGSSRVDPTTPSAVLEALVACLRALPSPGPGSGLPTLVLNGDILEMALAEDNVAAMVFDRFVDLAFATADPLFDDTIIYLPGNHDHHIWETARERQYARYVASVAPSRPLDPPWHVTRLFESASTPSPEAELLTALMRRRAGSSLTVKVVYPNLGLSGRDEERLVLFHHGHFTEPLYRLMSSLQAALFPAQPPGLEVWDWESDNFAWIDFFWSTLGRSGEAGADVGLVYDMLQNDVALARLTANLVDTAAGRLSFPLRPIVRALGPLAARPVARWAGGRERADPSVVLGPATRQGMHDYVSGPLRRQLQREHPDSDDARVSFVFGHTHKPFESIDRFSGFARPVSVYNTGGWVVDTEQTAEVQGAAVVLVDYDMQVASLRMYNQASSPASYRVSLADLGDGSTNTLRERLAGALDFSRPPWSELSAAVADAVARRHEALPKIIQHGLELTAVSRSRRGRLS